MLIINADIKTLIDKKTEVLRKDIKKAENDVDKPFEVIQVGKNMTLELSVIHAN